MKKDEIMAAIQAMREDTSVHPQDTMDSLMLIRDLTIELIEKLAVDIQNLCH